MKDSIIYMPPGIEEAKENSPKKLHWRVRYVNRISKRIVEKRVQSTGVYHSQHRMLMIISDAPDISQKELAQRMEISTAATAVSIKKLMNSGYIERNTDENDNRANKIKLTAKGLEVVKSSREMFDELHENIYKGFSEEERAQLAKYLERMCENVTEYYNETGKR
ncbi:MAG: winged helix-turn-helix transcriptional regulator [Lachnospiraceae bacterium]|nr:winged helix-turn-helix transcriptional regulator [Lachnospiraceae bacterium]